MTQVNLDREVARVTGESVRVIRNMGFTELPMPRLVAPAIRKARKPRGRVLTSIAR